MSRCTSIFSASVEALAYSGEIVATKDSGAEEITFPTFGVSEGDYPDLLTLLNGHGTDRSLEDEFNDAWTLIGGDGTIVVGYTSEGFIQVSKVGGLADFVIEGKVDNLYWGIENDDIFLQPGETYTGTTKPVNDRNLFTYNTLASGQNQMSIWVNDVGDYDEGFVPMYMRLAQSVPVMMRKLGDTDVESWISSANLATLDGEATGGDLVGRVEWGLTLEGKVYRASPFTLDPGAATFEWTEAGQGLARELGFTGNESMQIKQDPRVAGNAGKIYYLEASEYSPYVLAPKRGLYQRNLKFTRTNPNSRSIGGDYSSLPIATYAAFELGFILDGPARQEDMSSHYFYGWLRHINYGESIYFYQNFPEIRLAKVPSCMGFAYDLETDEYVVTQSGNMGMWKTLYSSENSSDITIDFDGTTSGVQLLTRETLLLDIQLDQLAV